MNNSVVIFIKTFSKTLFVLLLPVFIFLCCAEIYEQNMAATNPDATAFYIEDYKLILFDNTIDISILKNMKYFGAILNLLLEGLPKFLYNCLQTAIFAIQKLSLLV